jgi:asparagine synthase (glutamine-hydrolysing)
MCGINGYFHYGTQSVNPNVLNRMNARLAHRGPDDEGLVFIDADAERIQDFTTPRSAPGVTAPRWGDRPAPAGSRVGLGHVRFSIFDPTIAGHQPYWSKGREVVVVFNGEIYNHAEVRLLLEKAGRTFTSRSDTEVLVEAFLEWGPECVHRFNGFWAFLLWDTRTQSLFVSRDRIGVAPLYFARRGGTLWFSSEIKGIREAIGNEPCVVNQRAIVDFVQEDLRDFGDSTFFEGIFTFPRATCAWVTSDGEFQLRPYWRPPARLTEADIDWRTAVDGLRQRLSDAVELRLRSDVPVGFELSGGLDSSSIVAVAAQQREHLHAFTVSFSESSADERAFARQLVKRYAPRIEHIELMPPDTDFFDVADDFVRHLDEPFRSPNLQTHQALWRAIAAHGMRVSVNGAAGDELLGGYPDTFFAPLVSHLLRHHGPVDALRAFREAKDRAGRSASAHAAITLGRLVGWDWLKKRYRAVASHIDPFVPPIHIVPSATLPFAFDARSEALMGDHLMNYWLRSGNTTTMQVPLEVRNPFLDYRVVEFAMTLPPTYLIREGWNKWILRKAMNNVLPPEVAWRRQKMGFPFPYQQWFASNKSRLFHSLQGLDTPYVHMGRLSAGYDALAATRPNYLWRVVSVALWWKRCVQNLPLD